MAPNRERPYLYVLPEDDANRQLAIGFLVEYGTTRQAMMLAEANGWHEVLKIFRDVHVKEMNTNANQHMVLLIDFDGHAERLQQAKTAVPGHLSERVFILGVLGEPEDLKKAGLGHFAEIGKALAKDCRNGTNETWGHDLLRHNADEVDRLRERIIPNLL
ncbi:MAG TPA: hypothetical protein VI636_11895 [Candidatus Angelobacter sp.]